MKRHIPILIIAAFAAMTLLPAPAADHDHLASAPAAKEQLYTCGMHPQVIQKTPGNCPICQMKLTPMQRSADGGSGIHTIVIDPVTIQNMGFRSELASRGPLSRSIRTVGTIEFDETKLSEVTTKFEGWIEKLHVDSVGAQVHRGDPLFEIYAPDLYAAQVEYVLALNKATNAAVASESLSAAALAKLMFYDISKAQIAELEKSRQPSRTLQIASPADGFVIEKMVVQGQKVEAGMKLYRIADLGLVWMQAQIYEQDLPFVKLGQEAEVSLSYLADRKFRGRVTYIYPTVDEKTRTARVRMEFHNPGYLLKPGMFATVQMRAELERDALLVPDSAVLRSGEKNTVFVALGDGKFEPRTVTLGPRGEGDVYQVFSGLDEGDRVVTSGQFMLDSESQLREAIQKMLEPNAEGRAGNPLPAVSVDKPDDGAHGVMRPTTKVTTNAIYICPMPEHVSIQYDHPGKCSLCGMSLVPVSQATLDKIQPGGKVLHYACPMTEGCPTPGHGENKFDKPGKCPVCNMTLIPVMANQANDSIDSDSTLPKLYTCPMASHADVVTDKPGDCPKCGMTLVPTGEVGHGKIAEANWSRQHQH